MLFRDNNQSRKSGTVAQVRNDGDLMLRERTVQVDGYLEGLVYIFISTAFPPLPKSNIQLFISGSKILNSLSQSLDLGSVFLSHMYTVNRISTSPAIYSGLETLFLSPIIESLLQVQKLSELSVCCSCFNNIYCPKD